MSPQRFQRLQKEGVIPRFPPMEVDLDIVREAYIEHLRLVRGGRLQDPDRKPGGAGRLDLEQERAKVAARRAEKLDLELRRMRGTLVNAEEVRGALAAQDVVVKDRLLSVPMAVADRAVEAAAAEGARGVARVHDAAVRAALEALAGAEAAGAGAVEARPADGA